MEKKTFTEHQYKIHHFGKYLQIMQNSIVLNCNMEAVLDHFEIEPQCELHISHFATKWPRRFFPRETKRIWDINRVQNSGTWNLNWTQGCISPRINFYFNDNSIPMTGWKRGRKQHRLLFFSSSGYLSHLCHTVFITFWFRRLYFWTLQGVTRSLKFPISNFLVSEIQVS